MKFLSQSYVKYGLMMCGVVILCLSYMEISGNNATFDKSPLVAFWTFIAPAIIWFFGIRAKKLSQKNKLTIKEGSLEGLKISLVFAVVSPFIFLFYYIFVNPNIMEYVRTVYGMNNATLAVTLDLVIQFISSIIFGGIYGAIISFFLKSRQK